MSNKKMGWQILWVIVPVTVFAFLSYHMITWVRQNPTSPDEFKAQRLEEKRAYELEQENWKSAQLQKAQLKEKPTVEVVADTGVPGRYVTKEGYFACLTKADFDKINDFVDVQDMAAATLMVESQRCLVLKGGVEVQRMDSTWTGAVEIRPIGAIGTVWTYIEAIK